MKRKELPTASCSSWKDHDEIAEDFAWVGLSTEGPTSFFPQTYKHGWAVCMTPDDLMT